MSGTPEELLPISEKVLAWVSKQRTRRRANVWTYITEDDLRRIELMALATREAAMFHALYGIPGDEHA
jgi:hypothetical protein